MDLLQAIIIAIVEGLTEYLPISSTAHMGFTAALLGMEESEFLKMFQVSIQLAPSYQSLCYIGKNSSISAICNSITNWHLP